MRKLMTQKMLFLLLLGIAGFSNAATPEEEERARQEAFRLGMQEIVAGLNAGSTERFIAAIDRGDMLDRIFGLRLIEQRVKRDFQENLEYSYPGLIGSAFADSKDGITASLLGVESRGDRGRAVVRFDLPDFQFNYHEYELRLGDKKRLIVVDWVDFLRGQKFSDGVGMMLVMASPSKPAVRKLIDFQNVRESDLFQFTELLKAARDRQAERYLEIIDSLDDELQRQRVVVLTSVQLMKQIRNRRLQRTALAHMARHYPDEPLYALMLLDYYFPTRQYQQALASLQGLYARLDVKDAAMEARLSAAELVLGNVTEAAGHADAALQLEDGLELAWWSALRARAAQQDYAGAVTALQGLESGFGHELGPEALGRDPGLAGLVASDAYRAWLGTRE
jgi:hypothetical protein